MYAPSFDFGSFYGGGATTEAVNPVAQSGTAMGDVMENGGGKPTGGRASMGAGMPALLALLGLALAFAWVF